MGRFALDAGGQTLVLGTGSGSVFTDEARTSAVTVGDRLTDGAIYYAANGPLKLTLATLDGLTVFSGTVECPGTWDCPTVHARLSRDQMAAKLSVPRWDDMRVSLTKASVGSATPSLAVFRSPVQAWSFSKSALNEMFFDVQLPHNWVAGTDILPHIHWSPGASTDTGVVRWELEYTWASLGEAFPAATLLDPVDVAAAGVAYQHQLTKLGTCTGTGKKLSSVLMCRVARVGNATEDTFDAVAWGLSVDFHIQVLGSGGVSETAGA